MNVEQVKTEWFNPDAIRLPDYKVGRVKFRGGRSYIKLSSDGEGLAEPFRIYTSLTTAIAQCDPMPKQLLEWHIKHGSGEAKRLTRTAAHYGTLMHLLIGEMCIGGMVDFDQYQERVEEYTSKHNFWQPECEYWAEDLKKDVLAFLQFYQDYKVKPLAIECVMVSDKYGFGTLIDLVCQMSVPVKDYHGEVYASGANKGQPKITTQNQEQLCIVNFKSGKHGFYTTNGLQVEAERLLFEENFPDMPKIQGAYNWSPKEWTGQTPTYNLKNWVGTEAISVQEIELVLALAKIRYGDKALNKTYNSIEGMATTETPADQIVGKINVETYCKRRYSNEPV